HGHEMLFGFAIAVIAGFLLTAVRNWTGLPTAQDGTLAALVSVWLLARVLAASPGAPLVLVAVVDLSFDVALLGAVGVPIVRVRQWRQSGIIAKLVLLTSANAVFHAGAIGLLDPGVMTKALHAAVFLVVALVLTIAGRVLPGFIERGVEVRVTIRDRAWAARASLGAFLVFFVAELVGGLPWLAAAGAAGVALANGLRLIDWHTPALWRHPLLWGLYLALLAIEGGFVLYAVAPWWPVSRSLALHALAMGGIGLATLAMMARVSLGHTGRDIRRPPPVVGVALALLTSGVLARVVLPLALPTHYALSIGLAQACWIGAFALFLGAYWSILTRPRVDGRSG
ncbi:MAG: NnrS family protein, partial [Gammaproteobacteria bacterium]|nr:NnrS family protein [Gammaproteobacteria bacterium]